MVNDRKWGSFGWLIGFGALVAFPPSAFAQYAYRVGKGQASIEPNQQVLSVALAGYGAPREGGFSLEWTALARPGKADDATIAADRVYMLHGGTIRQMGLNDLGSGAIAVEQPESIRMIAGNGNHLVALNAHNELLETKISGRGKLRWRHRGTLQQTPRSLSYWKGRLVMLDSEGMLWTAEGDRSRLTWRPIIECEDVIDIMGNRDELYVLTAEQEILRYDEPRGWLRVAIRNGITYDQDMQLLMASSGGFWGMDSAGVLYQGQHSSTHQLAVNVLMIQKGKDRVALLGADVCGFDTSFVNGMKDEIQRKFGLPPNAVMVNASHTHFAPVTQNWHTWGPHCQKPDSAYLYTVVKSAVFDAMRQAKEALQPANLYIGKSEVEIGHNRSLPGNDLPYDKALDVIRVDYENLDKDDIVFLAGCHPVFQNAGREGLTISPNYPGMAREMLLHHSDVKSAMFLQGCGGDINPVDGDHRVTAEKVVSAVTEVLDQGAMQPIKGDITFYLDTVKFDSRPWPEGKIMEFRAANAGREGDVGAEKNVRWADLMLQYIKNDEMPTTMPVFVQTFNIGNWKLVGVSRETTTEYSLGIKALWPDKLVTVAGYCNDVSSYLPTRRHIQAGTYEGADSFFWYGQPNIFPENVYETIIEFIKSKNR
ncbi:hypothetical protein [Parapedobacter sp.]